MISFSEFENILTGDDQSGEKFCFIKAFPLPLAREAHSSSENIFLTTIRELFVWLEFIN